ncbi:hypothetical protein [Georgenia sp. SUBG003]|uniref:hypothetical protein n=1 Tax=Georgenia sp. SUBG003 TaxID=1497974 RepID=UPI003AB82441
MATTTPRTEREVTMQEDIITRSAVRKTLAVGRIIIGWTFLWAFIDKLFGLGYMTPAERAWISPPRLPRGVRGRRVPEPAPWAPGRGVGASDRPRGSAVSYVLRWMSCGGSQRDSNP